MIVSDPEVHVGGVRLLQHPLADVARDVEDLRVGDLVGGDDPRPHRAERVEGLAARPLAVAELQVARRDVVDARVAEDVVEGIADVDAAGPPADDHAELGLVVHLRCQGGIPADVGPGPDDRRRPLGEDQGRRRRLGAFLLRVVAVVPPDPDHLAWPWHGGEPVEVVERTTVGRDALGAGGGGQGLDGRRSRTQEGRHGCRAVGEELRGRHPSRIRDHAEALAAIRPAMGDQAHRRRPVESDLRQPGIDWTATPAP